jgi:hypothetical protein
MFRLLTAWQCVAARMAVALIGLPSPLASCSDVNRHLALVLNTALPGSGLLLRHPGLWPAVPAVFAAAGLSLIAVALATPGTATTIPVGWSGLALWLAALLAATIAWAVVERPSSRDLTAIQPLFREVAKAYLTGDLTTAERVARQLVDLASAEAGAWRLLALVTRAQGRTTQAAKLDRRAAKLERAKT